VKFKKKSPVYRKILKIIYCLFFQIYTKVLSNPVPPSAGIIPVTINATNAVTDPVQIFLIIRCSSSLPYPLRNNRRIPGILEMSRAFNIAEGDFSSWIKKNGTSTKMADPATRENAGRTVMTSSLREILPISAPVISPAPRDRCAPSPYHPIHLPAFHSDSDLQGSGQFPLQPV
jgi:hypothetical protein